MDWSAVMFGNKDTLIKDIVELTLSEDYVRALVGAPTNKEEEFCICGEELESCPESYVHMTSGV